MTDELIARRLNVSVGSDDVLICEDIELSSGKGGPVDGIRFADLEFSCGRCVRDGDQAHLPERCIGWNRERCIFAVQEVGSGCSRFFNAICPGTEALRQGDGPRLVSRERVERDFVRIPTILRNDLTGFVENLKREAIEGDGRAGRGIEFDDLQMGSDVAVVYDELQLCTVLQVFGIDFPVGDVRKSAGNRALDFVHRVTCSIVWDCPGCTFRSLARAEPRVFLRFRVGESAIVRRERPDDLSGCVADQVEPDAPRCLLDLGTF